MGAYEETVEAGGEVSKALQAFRTTPRLHGLRLFLKAKGGLDRFCGVPVGAAIEKSDTAGIHKNERFFRTLQVTSRRARFLTHGRAIDIFAALAALMFVGVTWYLLVKRGVLPGFTPPTMS